MRVGILYNLDLDVQKNYKNDWKGRDSNSTTIGVIEALKELGHSVKEYHGGLDMFETLRNEKDNIDVIFNLMEDGLFSKASLEPHVAAFLDALGLKYTGNGMLTSALCTNKPLAKRLMLGSNIPTPKFQIIEKRDEKISPMRYPLIVKPAFEDGSVGIHDGSVVHDEKHLHERVKLILEEYRQPALVEEFIDGREVSVAIIGDRKKRILPPAEIIFKNYSIEKPKIINYNAKWDTESFEYNNTERRFLEESDPVKKKVEDIAMKAVSLFSCRDYVRVDFRIDKEGNPYVIEVNPNPDIEIDAGLYAMAKEAGMSYSELIGLIVDCAFEREPIA